MDDLQTCIECGKEFLKKYNKSCGNCFACLGCEIYVCPFCGAEIIIKPLPDQV